MKLTPIITMTLMIMLAAWCTPVINAQELQRFTMNTKQGITFDIRIRTVTSAGDDPFFWAEIGESRPGYLVNATAIGLWFEGVSGDGTIFIRLRIPADLDDPRPKVDKVLRYRIAQDGTARIAVGVLGSGEIKGKRGKREILVFRARMTDQDDLQVAPEPQPGQTISKPG